MNYLKEIVCMGECQSSGTCCSASFLFSSSIFFILAISSLAGLNTPLVCWPHAAHRVVFRQFRGSVLVPVPKDTSISSFLLLKTRLPLLVFLLFIFLLLWYVPHAPYPLMPCTFLRTGMLDIWIPCAVACTSSALTYTSTHTHTHTHTLHTYGPTRGQPVKTHTHTHTHSTLTAQREAQDTHTPHLRPNKRPASEERHTDTQHLWPNERPASE